MAGKVSAATSGRTSMAGKGSAVASKRSKIKLESIVKSEEHVDILSLKAGSSDNKTGKMSNSDTDIDSRVIALESKIIEVARDVCSMSDKLGKVCESMDLSVEGMENTLKAVMSEVSGNVNAAIKSVEKLEQELDRRTNNSEASRAELHIKLASVSNKLDILTSRAEEVTKTATDLTEKTNKLSVDRGVIIGILAILGFVVQPIASKFIEKSLFIDDRSDKSVSVQIAEINTKLNNMSENKSRYKHHNIRVSPDGTEVEGSAEAPIQNSPEFEQTKSWNWYDATGGR